MDAVRHKYPETVMHIWWDQVTRARDRNIGWRLDYLVVSPHLKDRVVAADSHTEITGFDHCPVSLTWDL